MERIMLNGRMYEEVRTDGERMRIVIVDNRGLTFVGRCNEPKPGETLRIRDARCVIRWGTSQHLAEIAANGPTGKTALGLARDVVMHGGKVIAWYDTEDSLWQ